jgi:L-alanine-DL-glutamate epimerase-like enolase superfamily enzyme
MSNIDRVEIHEYAYEVDNLGWDHGYNRVYTPGARAKITSFVLVIRCRDGAVGEYPAMFGGKKSHLGQVQMLAPSLIGQDADYREALYDRCKRLLRQVSFLGVAAVDIALWDLAGKKLGASVSYMLGKMRDRLPTYVSTLHGDRNGGLSSKEAFADYAEQCHGLGFKAFKIHGWADGDPREEAENLLHLAHKVGNRMTLMIDPACELKTFADALYVGRACDDAGYFWYEDPFRDGGVSQHAHRKLRQMIKTPLLITEHVRGVEPKADWIVAEATDFVRADPEYDLGITGTMKIAHLAESFGLDVEIHAVGPAHRHCMASIRNTNWYELALTAPGVRNPVPPVLTGDYSDQLEAVGKDGCYPVPTGPGLGVTIDWDMVNRNRTALHVYE